MNERYAKWHLMTAKAVLTQLHTDAACGLSRKAARSRFKKDGANTLFDTPQRDIRDVLRPLFLDPAILLMLFSVLLSLCFLAIWQGLSVLCLLLSLSLLCVRILKKTGSTEERVAGYRIPTVRVIRDGKLLSISARRVVVGDLLLLQEGDIVPCDCRLLGETGLKVMTLMRNDEGKTVFHSLPKNAGTVYAYGTPDMEPYYENMLFGGSEIFAGEARAVAVGIGQDAYAARLENFTVPAELRAGSAVHKPIAAWLPYFRLYGFFTLFLMAILCVVSIFRLPSQYGIAEIMLSLCVLASCASPTILELWFGMLSAHGRIEAMHSTSSENLAIVKSERGMERLGDATDVIVVGRLASSDGVEHFSAAAVGSGLIRPEKGEIQPLLQPLCEAFFLLKLSGEGISVTMEERGDDDTRLLTELAQYSGLDLSALRVRLLNVKKRSDRSYGRIIDVSTQETEFSLCFSQDPRVLLRCMLYEDGDRLCTISPRLRDQLQAFCRENVGAGGKTVIVLRFHPDATCSLVGVVAMREEEQPILPSIVEELAQSGIRTTFFLSGDPAIDAAYADAYRLPRGHLTADGATPLTVQALEEHRVLIGYSRKDLERLLADLRNSGRRVALLCGGVKDLALLRHASLLMACDPTRYDAKNAEEAALEQLPNDGQENSARCAQVIRRRADLLIHRASAYGGGLFSVLRALSIGRGEKLLMRWLLSELIFSQLVTLTLTTLTVLFGIGLFGGVGILYAVGYADLIATLSLLSVRIPQYMTRRSIPLNESAIKVLLFSKKESTVLPAVIGATITALYAAILTWCGVIDASAACTYLLVSMILTKAMGIFLPLSCGVENQSIKVLVGFALLLLLPVGMFIPFSVWFAPVGAVTGLGAWTLVTALSLPIMPTIVLAVKFLPNFFHRTAK